MNKVYVEYMVSFVQYKVLYIFQVDIILFNEVEQMVRSGYQDIYIMFEGICLWVLVYFVKDYGVLQVGVFVVGINIIVDLYG